MLEQKTFDIFARGFRSAEEGEPSWSWPTRNTTVPGSTVAGTVAWAAVYSVLAGFVAGYCVRSMVLSKTSLSGATGDNDEASSADNDNDNELTPLVDPNTTDEELQTLRAEIDALRKEKESLETTVSTLQREAAESNRQRLAEKEHADGKWQGILKLATENHNSSVQQLRDELAEAHQKLHDEREARETLEERQHETASEMESLQKRLAENDEHLKSEYLSKVSLEKALAEAQTTIQDKESLEETTKNAIKSLSTEKEQLESDLRRSVAATQEVEQTLRSLEREHEASKTRVQELQDSLDSADAKRNEQEAEFAKLNEEKKALDALLRETKELNRKNVSTLEQLGADKEKELEDFKGRLERSKAEVQNLQKSLDDMSSKLREQEAGFIKVNGEKKALDAELREKKEMEEKQFQIPDVLLESEYVERVKLAVELARKAGANKQKLGGFWLGSDKNSNTTVDIKNEKIIMDGIKELYPDDNIIGEESSRDTSLSKSDGYAKRLYGRKPYWVVNPLDGSTNFLKGLNALACVSIAYCAGAKPVFGISYAPGLDELYIAVENKGAFCNGKRIFQKQEESVKTVERAVICSEMGQDIDGEMGKSVDKDAASKLLIAETHLRWKGCRSMRQLGSGCLDLCFVASGRLDAVYSGLGSSQRWGPWDYAAGLVICKEAGCTMESIEGQENPGCDGFDLYSSTMICGVSNELVSDLRNTLMKPRK